MKFDSEKWQKQFETKKAWKLFRKSKHKNFQLTGGGASDLFWLVLNFLGMFMLCFLAESGISSLIIVEGATDHKEIENLLWVLFKYRFVTFALKIWRSPFLDFGS